MTVFQAAIEIVVGFCASEILTLIGLGNEMLWLYSGCCGVPDIEESKAFAKEDVLLE